MIFNLAAARWTSEAPQTATSARRSSDDLEAARTAVITEESLERKYRLEPSNVVRTMHRQSSRDIVFVADILRAHVAYVAATEKMFAAVDRKDARRVIELDHNSVDPVFGKIEGSVFERATEKAEKARAGLVGLSSLQQLVVTMTIAFSIFGFLGLVVYLGVLRSYQKQFESNHRAAGGSGPNR